MKGMVKAIIAGGVIIAVGLAILITGFALSDWNVTATTNFEMQRYEATDVNSSLEIDFGAGSLKTEFYDGERIIVDYPTAKGYYMEITEGYGKLSLETKSRLFFINAINIPETVIHIPRTATLNLDVELGAGSVSVAGGTYGKVEINVGAGTLTFGASECASFDADVSAGTLTADAIKCGAFDADVSAGKLTVEAIECNYFDADVSAGKLSANSVICQRIKAKVSAGSAVIAVKGIKSEYTIISSVSAGSCNVSSQQGTTDKSITVTVSSGSANLSFND